VKWRTNGYRFEVTSADGAASEFLLQNAAQLPALRRWITALRDRDRPELDAETLDVVHLVATELAANALEHADGPRALRLSWPSGRDAVLIEVDDGSPQRRPVPGRSSAGPFRGRGLVLTNHLAEWGLRVHSGHKTLWARVSPAQGQASAAGTEAPPTGGHR
jgi:two-component sensor histidine kinase